MNRNCTVRKINEYECCMVNECINLCVYFYRTYLYYSLVCIMKILIVFPITSTCENACSTCSVFSQWLV